MRYRELHEANDPIHPEVQRMEHETLAHLRQDFPQVGLKLRLVHERRNNATFDPWDFEIKLPIYGMDRPLADVDRAVDAKNPPGYVVTAGLRGEIVHEFGHAIDHYIIKHASEDVKDKWFDIKRALAAKHEGVSPYAMAKSQEWLPEQFTAEYLGMTSPVIIPVIREFLKLVS